MRCHVFLESFYFSVSEQLLFLLLCFHMFTRHVCKFESMCVYEADLFYSCMVNKKLFFLLLLLL